MTTTITLWTDSRSWPVTARLFFGDFRENQVWLDFWLRSFSHVALRRCLDGLLAQLIGFNRLLDRFSLRLRLTLVLPLAQRAEFSGAFAVGHGERHPLVPNAVQSGGRTDHVSGNALSAHPPPRGDPRCA